MIIYLLQQIDSKTFVQISDMMEKDFEWELSCHHTLGNYVRNLLLKAKFGISLIELDGIWAELIREAVLRKVLDANVLTLSETG